MRQKRYVYKETLILILFTIHELFNLQASPEELERISLPGNNGSINSPTFPPSEETTPLLGSQRSMQKDVVVRRREKPRETFGETMKREGQKSDHVCTPRMGLNMAV